MLPLRVGIAGLGTVGSAVLGRLDRDAETLASKAGRGIIVTGVSARDRAKAAALLGEVRWFDDAVMLARSPDIDVFVELIGGHDGVAKQAVEAAISAGKSVVTANKALLAHHGMALAEAAEAAGVEIGFEAAVAGGIPIVKTLRESMDGNTIARVYGILNGTCNYILTRMERGGDWICRWSRRGSASRLRRGGSDLRYRRSRYGPQTGHSGGPRFRHGDRPRRDPRRGHSFDHQRRTSGQRTNSAIG